MKLKIFKCLKYLAPLTLIANKTIVLKSHVLKKVFLNFL